MKSQHNDYFLSQSIDITNWIWKFRINGCKPICTSINVLPIQAATSIIFYNINFFYVGVILEVYYTILFLVRYCFWC